MLSNEQLREAYNSGFNNPELDDDSEARELAGFRAMEAVVREDQIRQDAVLVLSVDRSKGIPDSSLSRWQAGIRIAVKEAAGNIRAQLVKGGN